MAITIAYDESREINNVRFTNNVVEADVPSNFMTFGKLSDCVIADNEFIVHHTTNYTSGVIFDARPGVTVKDNHITVTSKENGGLSQIFKRGGIFENNIVDCDCYVYAMSYLESIVRNNTIHIKGGCKTLGLDITEMSGNDIIVDGYMETYRK